MNTKEAILALAEGMNDDLWIEEKIATTDPSKYFFVLSELKERNPAKITFKVNEVGISRIWNVHLRIEGTGREILELFLEFIGRMEDLY